MTEFILEAIARAGYLGIFLLMALENIFPPIPSEVIMGLGGMAVSRGRMELLPLIAIATAGTTAGNYFWYWLGARTGYLRLRPFIERHGRWLTLDWPAVERLERFFHRHGEWVIFVFRFMPLGRTIISLPAGMARMPLWKFFLWTFAGSAIWNTLLAYAGIVFDTRFERLHDYVGPASLALLALAVVGYAYRVATWRPEG
jgi:membrane protein DedA with SNARE-associated domain